MRFIFRGILYILRKWDIMGKRITYITQNKCEETYSHTHSHTHKNKQIKNPEDWLAVQIFALASFPKSISLTSRIPQVA